MFPNRLFPRRFWTASYWPKVGADSNVSPARPALTFQAKGPASTPRPSQPEPFRAGKTKKEFVV